MLGAKLARRIVLPLLLLTAGLFALLAVASVWISEQRVTEELEQKADRVAATLDGLPSARPELLEALGRLVGADLVVDGVGTRGTQAEVDAVAAGTATLDGATYRAMERTFGRPPKRVFVLVAEEHIAVRRRDVLVPVAVAGALGLLVALLLGLAVARQIARPVRGLADSVREFASGGGDPGTGERGPGEIGELQDAFRRMVTEIREGQEKLRESERFAALGRLAGGIAHELRNPLTAIRMAVEMAAEEGNEARQVALSEIDRLDRTLRELLDFVRPREPTLEDVDVPRLFREVTALLGPQCEHLKVALEAEAPEGLTVRADADRLKQALLNLVLNGAQAQPLGGVVRLRAGPSFIEVEDAGGGISEKVRETLLQPFVTTKAAGIGLGLAVVAQVADEHGAKLDFRTGTGGTTFRIKFRE